MKRVKVNKMSDKVLIKRIARLLEVEDENKSVHLKHLIAQARMKDFSFLRIGRFLFPENERG